MLYSPNYPQTTPDELIIASRESALAMWQAEHIADRLRALYPRMRVSILGMTTQGDQILDSPLSRIGGKGLFVKELETAIAEGRAHIAVHSMKDVPMNLPEGFRLAAIGEREDPRDAFVSSTYASLDALPAGARVGTSSLRRECQLRARNPQLIIEPLRGNVQTRLRKLDEGQYDAIILAAAGLKRLGLGARIRNEIPPEQSLPAVGQGALGIECLAGRDDLVALLAPLNHIDTADCVRAERAMSRALGGSCQVPLGGYAQVAGDILSLRGFVAEIDGSRIISGSVSGARQDAEILGCQLANQLLAQGAGAILATLSA
ncbi:porphobilinogen deaminase [Sulfuriferula plumbiphila]|uniref:Porphobilinogen deaminase n=1 Tax=Sulfuriferula plumbiphila TaxID=171865 RepID=A0A512L9D7_9PROT|nr:hydroxymethylbilane synthase [Sulfuriferula plumbiphila]BBP05953.1 porphobilinogen deaminase [Sulfuriferula plumbiphila]GEP31105.1 porphobilinogen deaminase [Sulfuriferula plumbiphila]